MTQSRVSCALRAIPLPSRVVMATDESRLRVTSTPRTINLRVGLSNSLCVGSAWDGEVDSWGYGRRPVHLRDPHRRQEVFGREYWPREKVFLVLFVWRKGLTMKYIRQGTGLDTGTAGGGYGALNSLIKLSKTGDIRRLPRDLSPDARAALAVRRHSVLHLLLNESRELADSVVMKIRSRAWLGQ